MNLKNIKYLSKSSLSKRVAKLNDDYWNRSWERRWIYMWPVIVELRKLNPNTIIELGAYKINLTNISDNMDLEYDFIDIDNLNNKIYIQDATKLPWNIPDKYYDVFIALQVFEHFENNNQGNVFNEVARISKNAILSFPYKWESKSDMSHYMIDEKIIAKWTNNITPDKIITVNSLKPHRRIVYTYKF